MGGNPLADLAWFAGDRKMEDVEPTLKGRTDADGFLSCVLLGDFRACAEADAAFKGLSPHVNSARQKRRGQRLRD